MLDNLKNNGDYTPFLQWQSYHFSYQPEKNWRD
jgi:hypothetical protein